MLTATILFLNENSKKNKNLTDQLQSILDPAVRRGRLTFNFKIIAPADAEKAQKYGVTKFPAMLINKKPYQEVSAIMTEIRNRIGQSRGEVAAKSEDEMLHDFQMGEFANLKRDAAGNIVDPEGDGHDSGHALQEKMQTAMKQRAEAARGFAGNKFAEQPSYTPQQQTRRDDHDIFDHGERPRPAPPRGNNVAPAGDVFDSIARTRSAEGASHDDDLILNAMFNNNLGSD
jgi:hypothetical protein